MIKKNYPRFFKRGTAAWTSNTRFLRINELGVAYYIFSSGDKGESCYSEADWEIMEKEGQVIEITEAEAALL